MIDISNFFENEIIRNQRQKNNNKKINELNLKMK